MKKILSTCVLLFSSHLFASEQFIIKIPLDGMTVPAAVAPEKPVNSYTGIDYALTVIDNYGSNVVANDVLRDHICFGNNATAPIDVCAKSEGTQYITASGFSNTYDVVLDKKRSLTEIDVAFSSYVNCGNGDRLKVLYYDSASNSFVDTGIKIGHAWYITVEKIPVSFSTDHIKLVNTNEACAAAYSYVSELRFY